MGPVNVGEKLSRQVTLQADRDFTVTAVDGQADGVTALYLSPRKARKAQGITIEFAPEVVGPVTKVLTIHTDIGESVKLTVEGTGEKPDPKAEPTGNGKPEPKALPKTATKP